MPVITNISCYKFAPLENLKPIREQIATFCKERDLKGTILLSTEGINFFVAGQRRPIDQLVQELRNIQGLSDLKPKYSENNYQPFNRMLVKIKKEIISFGVEGIDPARKPSPKLSAKQLKQWLDEGKPITLLDTRNDYEIKLGTFNNAIPANIRTFREFPEAVRKLPEELKKQPVVMFCTGGIRCEKAGPFMEREGYEQIFQLDGGILKYFEECGGEHYQGECFVFDQRVGVDQSLQETDNSQCVACLTPLTVSEQRDSRFQVGISCPYCFIPSAEQIKKNIALHQSAINDFCNPLPGSIPKDNLRPLRISAHQNGMTLIEYLSSILDHIPKEKWLELIANGKMLDGNKQPTTADRIVQAGEKYFHLYPEEIEPSINANIRIIHEDEAILVINKPAPLPVHASGRFNRNTLRHILGAVYSPENPRPAHRLDAMTTGVLVCARTKYFAGILQPQFEQGDIEKVYLAKVHGTPVFDEFECDAAICEESGELGARAIDLENGQPSKTLFKVLQRFSNQTALLEVRPLTGRTNQIRIHLWYLGYPIVGDPVYFKHETQQKVDFATTDGILCLHAWKISFDHPLTHERTHVEATPPDWTN